MTKTYEEIVSIVRTALVDAGSTVRSDKKEAFQKAINSERNEKAKWVLNVIMENIEIAEKNKMEE